MRNNKHTIKALSYIRTDDLVDILSNASDYAIDTICQDVRLPFDGGDKRIKVEAIVRRAIALRADRVQRQRRSQRRFKLTARDNVYA